MWSFKLFFAFKTLKQICITFKWLLSLMNCRNVYFQIGFCCQNFRANITLKWQFTSFHEHLYQCLSFDSQNYTGCKKEIDLHSYDTTKIVEQQIPCLRGAFTNYVDNILAFFDHLPTCFYIFYLINVDERLTFWNYLPTSSCQRSLWTPPNLDSRSSEDSKDPMIVSLRCIGHPSFSAATLEFWNSLGPSDFVATILKTSKVAMWAKFKM